MKWILILFWLCLALMAGGRLNAVTQPVGGGLAGELHRVVVSTDIGEDPDDFQQRMAWLRTNRQENPGDGLLSSPSARVVTYDARPLQELEIRQQVRATTVWDTMHLLAALQGLVNRDAPRLYLFYCDDFGVETDRFWWEWYRHEDGWLRTAEVESAASIEDLLTRFGDAYDGLVVYDPAVPATSNAASTVAGCDRLLPVRFDLTEGSLYRLLTGRLELPVRVWLVEPDGSSRFTGTGTIPDLDEPSTGSAKNDVYRWASRRYLEIGGCSAGRAAYYLDAWWIQAPQQARTDMHTLSNHDYFIARRGFFFDLSPWGDEPPVDDPVQPTGLDRRTLIEILYALQNQAGGQMIQLGGFVPWPYKYTTHGRAGRHEPVPAEWEFSRLISQFNVYKEADAANHGAIANASFHQHYPLGKRYRQPNPAPGIDQWRARGYVADDGRVAPRFYLGHYVGDYDSPSWLYKAVAAFWKDPDRGAVPLGWAFNPSLAQRAPQAMVYAYRHASTNDFFIAGNSGAGYVNPRALTARPDSNLPSGLEIWRRHCQEWYWRWDMTITGFVLDGSAGASTETEFAIYRTFSPDGLGTHFEPGPAMRAGIPTCPETDLPHDVRAAAAMIVQRAAARGNEPGFFWARSILRAPRWYAELSRLLQEDYSEAGVEVVDPYTFFGLIRLHLVGRP